MNSEIKVYPRPNGEIQRVQCLRWEDWSRLDFLQLQYHNAAVGCFADIYENFLVPACPWLFGNMVMFHVPEDVMAELEVPMESARYGRLGSKLTAVALAMEKGVKIRGGKPVFTDSKIEALWKQLEARDCVRVIRGKLPFTKMIPVGNCPGYLTETEPDAAMKVNASFFIMDSFDCATVYDHVGTVLGLCVKDGVVTNPPLYHREALLVKKDGSVSVSQIDIRDMEIEIAGVRYKHGENATIYTRPERMRTPSGGEKKLVIVGNRVVAVKDGGSVEIPASGYVIRVDKDSFVVPRKNNCGSNIKACTYGEVLISYVEAVPGDEVIYHGMEDVQFGIQVGNSLVRDGVKTERFISRFYNIYHLEPVPYPPSLYPMDYDNARAARIALGADKDGKPMLLWAEGAAKFGYVPGESSCGASLKELAEIAEDMGMVNGVNLDGGGSAQILVNHERMLKISDRNRDNHDEAERLVPLGLVVR